MMRSAETCKDTKIVCRRLPLFKVWGCTTLSPVRDPLKILPGTLHETTREHLQKSGLEFPLYEESVDVGIRDRNLEVMRLRY